jgi:hypothetical protein
MIGRWRGGNLKRSWSNAQDIPTEAMTQFAAKRRNPTPPGTAPLIGRCQLLARLQSTGSLHASGIAAPVQHRGITPALHVTAYVPDAAHGVLDPSTTGRRQAAGSRSHSIRLPAAPAPTRILHRATKVEASSLPPTRRPPAEPDYARYGCYRPGSPAGCGLDRSTLECPVIVLFVGVQNEQNDK